MTTRFPADPTDYKNLLAFMMHELRRIHEVLDSNATQLSIAVRGESADVPRIRNVVPLMLEELYVMHSWLSIADFYLDPAQFARQPKQRISLFRLFDKARRQLSRRAKSRSLQIHLDGDGEHAITGGSLFGIVPYILLDNALKYAPSSGRIDISFRFAQGFQVVEVSSVGPHVEEEEVPRLFEPGERGKWASTVTREGNGQGLALLRAICLYHEGTVKATSSPHVTMFNKIPYSTFAIEVAFPAAPTPGASIRSAG